MAVVVNIETKDKYTLSGNCYEVVGSKRKGIIIVCPAMGVKQSFYKDFAYFMATQGFITYTFDYRGMGASGKSSLKHFSADLMDWAIDIQAVFQYAQAKDEQLPIFAVTHSVGGQLLALTETAKDWAGIVSVASQSGYWKHWTGKHKARMWFFWHLLLPGLTKPMGYFPAKKLGLFENLPKGVALQWARWGRHPLYLKREFPTAYFDTLTCPIKAYSFSDDEEFAPKTSVDWLHQQYENTEVERLHIESKSLEVKKVGHFGFFRSTMQAIFWETIVSFFENESNKRLIKNNLS